MTLPTASAAMASPVSPTPSVPTTAPRLLAGLREITAGYDGFLIDLWGVTHNGSAPYAGALAALQALRQAGKKIAFVSNSSSVAPNVAAQLTAMGITDYDVLITSGGLVAQALQENDPSLWRAGFAGKALLVGDSSILAQYNAPLSLVREPAAAGLIINAWYGDSIVEVAAWQPEMPHWQRLGLPMLCANPDYDVVLPQGRLLCPGAFAAAYEAVGGTVHYYGKPYAPAFAAGRAALRLPPTARLAMIGDNLQTDIRGGRENGLDTVLILGGVHGAALGSAWGAMPSMERLTALCQKEGYTPTYA
ncbi:MAG: TIGR01459 family HAD-type hydrolase, partial [Alphaproteobacteria bacterium]|nr:TIGR01459 family HAD-type hydrolase [Alphaproteobacteria bacterium]